MLLTRGKFEELALTLIDRRRIPVENVHAGGRQERH